MIFLQILVVILVCTLWLFIFYIFFSKKIRNSAPVFPSSRKLRKIVACEIRKNYKNSKNILDIGSGFGGLARKIACENPHHRIYAVEQIYLLVAISRLSNIFSRRKVKFLHADVFEFIKKSRKFDIGVAYLFPPMMPQIEKIRTEFDVLIILDFPLPNVKFSRKIEINKGKLSQRIIYIYE